MKPSAITILIALLTGLIIMSACQGAQPTLDVLPTLTLIPTLDVSPSSTVIPTLEAGSPSAPARLTSPLPGAIVASPLVIEGEARGLWFFEASFPIHLYDADGNLLGTTVAQAQGDWMTEDYVPFTATLEFSPPATATGTLVLERDNPSGLPENSGEIHIPVRFR